MFVPNSTLRARRALRIQKGKEHDERFLREAEKLGMTRRKYKNHLEHLAYKEGVSKKKLAH